MSTEISNDEIPMDKHVLVSISVNKEEQTINKYLLLYFCLKNLVNFIDSDKSVAVKIVDMIVLYMIIQIFSYYTNRFKFYKNYCNCKYSQCDIENNRCLIVFLVLEFQPYLSLTDLHPNFNPLI